MPQLRVHPDRAFKGGFTGSGGALMYMDGLGVQKNRGPTKLLELSWAIGYDGGYYSRICRISVPRCWGQISAHFTLL